MTADRYHLERREPPLNVVVCDQNGLIFLPLSSWAIQIADYMSPETVFAYVRSSTRFLNWINQFRSTQGISINWDNEPEKIRFLAEEFLHSWTGAQKRGRGKEEGRTFIVEKRKRSGVNIFLSAISNFYDSMISEEKYRFFNPFKRNIPTHSKSHFEIKTEQYQLSKKESSRPWEDMPSDCFYSIYGKQWLPQSIDNPKLAKILLNAPDMKFWTIREIIILQILLSTGCRISEACGVTLKSWLMSSELGNSAYSFSKGSRKVPVKTLSWRPELTQLLWTYYEKYRVPCSGVPQMPLREILEHGKTIDPGDLNVPLFTTRRGTPLSPKLYRDYFFRKFKSVLGLKLRLHQVRHHYVTSMMREIQRSSSSQDELKSKMKALVASIHWADGEAMLKVYSHILEQDSVNVSMAELSERVSTGNTDNRLYAAPESLPLNLLSPKDLQ